MAETKKTFSTKAHGLGVVSIICLVIGGIIMLSSLASQYVTQQTATMLYALFFLILAAVFQIMKVSLKN